MKGAVAVGTLAYFAAFFSAAVFLSVYLPFTARFTTLLSALLLLPALLFHLRNRKRRKRLYTVLPVCLLALMAGSLHTQQYLAALEARCRPYHDTERIVECMVSGLPQENEYQKTVAVCVDGIRCCLRCGDDFTYGPGDRLRFFGSFHLTSEMEGKERCLIEGIPLYAAYETEPEYLGTASASLRYFPAGLGAFLQRRIRQLFPEETAALLLAILTGNRTLLNENVGLLADLRLCGVSHSIAISGMHVSYLTSILWFLAGRRRKAGLICIPVTLVFMAMTGFTPSVTRAGVLQIGLCLAGLLGRDHSPLEVLSYALLLLTVRNPLCAKSIALQLSFGAVLGIRLCAGQIEDSLELPERRNNSPLRRLTVKLHHVSVSSFSVTVGALVFTLPLSLLYFGQVSLLSLFSNLLLLWSISACFALGLGGVLLSLISMPAAKLLAVPADLLLRYLSLAARFLGKVPLSTVSTQTVLPLLWLFSLYAVLPLVRRLHCISRKKLLMLLCCLGGFALSWTAELLPTLRGELRYSLLNVGQGQCITVSAGKSAVLIDCGGSQGNAGDTAADYLATLCKSRADALILTHYHSDHTNGIDELLRRVRIRTLYAPQPDPADAETMELLRKCVQQGIDVQLISENTVLNFDAFSCRLVPPPEKSKENEACMAVLTECGAFSALTTGDAGFETELRAAEELQADTPDILVVGHHGSANSCSAAYLSYLMPERAWISVGNNQYGLPSEETLERLREFGVSTERTDRDGTLVFRYQARSRCRKRGERK